MGRKKEENLPKIESLEEMLERYGLANNEFVRGVKNRYIMQLTIINRLNEQISKQGLTVEKKYSDTYNMYINPCVAELKNQISVANNTAITLTKIISELGKLKEEESKSEKKTNPLAEMLSD